MKKQIGLWIDHEKAWIVTISDSKEDITKIESGVERKVRMSGGSRSATPYGPKEIASERKREDKYKRHLSHYYQKLVTMIQDADEILIFGPGEAKVEFNKEIAKSKGLAEKVKGIEPADKMTENQIKAKVKEFYVS